jgi:hypothetical protein
VIHAREERERDIYLDNRHAAKFAEMAEIRRKETQPIG